MPAACIHSSSRLSKQVIMCLYTAKGCPPIGCVPNNALLCFFCRSWLPALQLPVPVTVRVLGPLGPASVTTGDVAKGPTPLSPHDPQSRVVLLASSLQMPSAQSPVTVIVHRLKVCTQTRVCNAYSRGYTKAFSCTASLIDSCEALHDVALCCMQGRVAQTMFDNCTARLSTIINEVVAERVCNMQEHGADISSVTHVSPLI